MRLRDVGEFGLISRIEKLAARAARAPGVVLGIGDDAALLRLRPGEDLVLTSDASVENVHFRFTTDPPRVLGRRVLVANLSDLAAMGARPLGFTVALAAPPSLELRTALAMARGLVEEGARAGCPLVGGNVTRSRQTSLTVAACGAVARGRALRRDAARPGDRLLVTGCLGASALARVRAERFGTWLRRVPEPRLQAGRALARLAGAGACIDVSDGLVADLRHVLAASGVGAELDAQKVPRPRGFAAACRRLGLDATALALGGGEDYELLFTVRPAAPPAGLLARRLGVAVTEIGRIVPRGLWLRGASPAGGWRHF